MSEPNHDHGYLLLVPGDDGALPVGEIDRALMALGFGPYRAKEDSGRPAFVVLDARSAKACWFAAGFWAGQRVPLFVIGSALRRQNREVVARMGGWTLDVPALADLTAAVLRRGLAPTAWDAERVEVIQEAIRAKAVRDRESGREEIPL